MNNIRLKDIVKKGIYKENEKMSKYTSFKVGGEAKIYINPFDENELIDILKFCINNNIKFYVLGNCTNVLISDNCINQIIIHLNNVINYIKLYDDTRICVGAGTKISSIAKFAYNASLSGFENLTGIPGTVGGSIRMNAGSYGSEIKDILETIKIVDKNGDLRILKNKDIDLSYRHSNVKENDYIILSAIFKLKKLDKLCIKETMEEVTKKRINNQPLKYPNAGSIFKKVNGISSYVFINKNIERGYSIGGASISSKHSGFIINKQNATAMDIYNLIKYIKKEVKDKEGVLLEEEIDFIGEFNEKNK